MNNKLIHHIRVPAEQFAYLETDFKGSAEEAVALYKHITSLVKLADGGVPMKEFEEIIQLMIEGEPIKGDPGIIEGFSAAQRFIFDLVRKIVNRIDYKNR